MSSSRFAEATYIFQLGADRRVLLEIQQDLLGICFGEHLTLRADCVGRHYLLTVDAPIQAELVIDHAIRAARDSQLLAAVINTPAANLNSALVTFRTHLLIARSKAGDYKLLKDRFDGIAEVREFPTKALAEQFALEKAIERTRNWHVMRESLTDLLGLKR